MRPIALTMTCALLAGAGCEEGSPAEARVHRDPPRAAAPAERSTAEDASPHSPAASAPSCNAAVPEEAEERRYAIRSGVIEYRIHGSLGGRELLRFDRYGLRESRYTETVLAVLDEFRTSRELVLIDGAWVTKIDLDTRSGVRMRDPAHDAAARSRRSGDLTSFAEEVLERLGGRRRESERILDRDCAVWDLPAAGARIWIWNGVALRTEISGPGSTIIHEVVRFDADADVPDDVFAVPEGITIRADNAE